MSGMVNFKEPAEDPIPLGEKHRAQELCIVVPISYIDSQSTVYGTDIDLSTAPETDTVGDDGYVSSDPFDHEVYSDSDPDVDEIRRIVIHNNLGAHISLIDSNAAHAAEFSEYPDLLAAHWLVVNSDPEELFVGQKFESKEKSTEGCNWEVRAAFIQKSQMWEIRKFVGSHTCTSAHITEDHRKPDSKTICTCIMPMVKNIPKIKVSILIAKMQAQFQYRVLYRKVWIAK
ncbi:hypothetical protein PVK06_005031 [Gossypium arboreum]|uniref:Uncharacterized protein n=1 Tax=Gossypium arboreum TaxID=29729 RepID=A0ABR0QTJ7_GOSAR|nr:hypothetical protein PVK06_005031 [Gossypium arboreum]